MSSLFKIIMRGNWDEVVDKYRGESRRVKITDSGDTVMHIAARLAKPEHVRKLVRKIRDDEAFDILSLTNDRGNTPLHLAAQFGDVFVCGCIGAKDHRLLSVRNSDEETPLYVSVANGHKDAFFHLDYLLRRSRSEIDHSLYRRKDGYTILHAAVFRGYFGLAIQIVKSHKKLVNSIDDFGLSPLHILAGKYSAFESGTVLRPIDKKLLEYLHVEKLVEKEKENPVVDPNLSRTANPPQTRRTTNDVPVPKASKRRRARGNRRRQLQSQSPFSLQSPRFCSLKNGERMLKKLGEILLRWTIVFISYIGLFFKEILKMAGIGWLDIHYLIQLGLEKRKSLIEKKIRWELAKILLNDLVNLSSMYSSAVAEEKDGETNKKPIDTTPFLIAARMGVTEVVDAILHNFPVAAFDLDSELKNAAMLAAENKRVDLYGFLEDNYTEEMEQMMAQLDKQGNSVLHLWATFGKYTFLYTPDPVALLRTEYSDYKSMKEELPPEIVALQNLSGLTADGVFTTTYEKLITSASEWLIKTSESCSVVAALIATVAFATLAVDTPSADDKPMLVSVSLFDFYCFFGLLALCFSVVSLLYFLAIRTSGFMLTDFDEKLPMKLSSGLKFLLLSMVSILASFCFRHYSMLENDTIKDIVIPTYILTSISVLSLAASQLPFYHGCSSESKFREPI